MYNLLQSARFRIRTVSERVGERRSLAMRSQRSLSLLSGVPAHPCTLFVSVDETERRPRCCPLRAWPDESCQASRATKPRRGTEQHQSRLPTVALSTCAPCRRALVQLRAFCRGHSVLALRLDCQCWPFFIGTLPSETNKGQVKPDKRPLNQVGPPTCFHTVSPKSIRKTPTLSVPPSVSCNI